MTAEIIAILIIIIGALILLGMGVVCGYKLAEGRMRRPRRYYRPINTVKRAKTQARREIERLDWEAAEAMDDMEQSAMRHMRNRSRRGC